MLAIDHLPYTHVEDVGLLRVTHHAWPNYKVPSRSHFSQTVIPTIYKEVRQQVATSLHGCTSLALTSDEWTSMCSKFGVVSLTASYLTDDFQKRSVTLCSQKISGSATANNVASILDKVIDSWENDIGLREKITSVTTDEGKLFRFSFISTNTNNIKNQLVTVLLYLEISYK